MNATAQPATANANAEKFVDWPISSRVRRKRRKGSTTTWSSLTAHLKEQYEQGKTVRQLANESGIPSRTIARWLNEVGARVRKPGQRGAHVFMTGDWLREQYVTRDKSAERIAAEQDVSANTVRRMLRRHGIAIRRSNKGRRFDPAMHRAHARWLIGRFVGALNPNWRGGRVAQYRKMRNTEAHRAWAVAVKMRDGYRCVRCGSQYRLAAHHIKRWKVHPELRHDVANGETLCQSCHTNEHLAEMIGWAKGKTCKSTRHPANG